MLLPAQRRQWETDGHCTLHVVGTATLRSAAVTAAQLLARPEGGAAYFFPFAEEQRALSELTFEDGIRLALEQLLCGGRTGGLRLIHSSVEKRTSTTCERDERLDAVDSARALTLAPCRPTTTAAGGVEAACVLVPLDDGSEAAGVLVCRFDPTGQYPAAAAAVATMRSQHTTIQRVVLRVASAEHIQCDSYGRDGGPAWLFRSLSPEQRTLVGFPLPGHSYWTYGTASAVAARYALDPCPYLVALPRDPPTEGEIAAAERRIFGGPAGRPASCAKPKSWGALSPPVWHLPDKAQSSDDQVLSVAQVRHWHRHGYLVLDDLWPAATIAAAAAAAEDMYPVDMPSDHRRENRSFPFSRSALNDVVLHSRVLKAVTQLLFPIDGCKSEADSDLQVRYYGGGLTLKHGTTPVSGDQGMHLDFGNNTLLVPPAQPETVAIILNYSPSATESDGATRFVATDGVVQCAPEPGALPSRQSPLHDSPEELYGRERAVKYRAGTALLYRLDLLHRGSPVLPGAHRYTHHMNYRKAECDWVGHNTWAKDLWLMDRHGAIDRAHFLASLTCAQRRAIGAPADVSELPRRDPDPAGHAARI